MIMLGWITAWVAVGSIILAMAMRISPETFYWENGSYREMQIPPPILLIIAWPIALLWAISECITTVNRKRYLAVQAKNERLQKEQAELDRIIGRELQG